MRTLGPKSGVAPVVGPPHVAVAVQLAGQLERGTLDPDEATDPVDDVLPAAPTPTLPEVVEPLLASPEVPLAVPDDGDALTPDAPGLPALAPLRDETFPEAPPTPLDVDEFPDVPTEVCVPDPFDWAPDSLQPQGTAEMAAPMTQRVTKCISMSTPQDEVPRVVREGSFLKSIREAVVCNGIRPPNMTRLGRSR
jgi:hypothetical protein